eukprot:CAMPEP_0197289486 /NCGR_PEP_ID=MMETSP0890-20130614/6765_1 /TAXON_ID=44058 ORGANISM="Aureoumbra lagunensis, Strain CCMP1510" /NCGR_SAMPLE_ID=MMETSP0890 /ASSEMBLY_ACC=CAM_ASM_000533 /LENGTH=180 /DNA_ID=CAMNT_0042760945 /DNA_START=129 /DNA_END=671 /DNA_ORIENTATION=-
MPLNEVYPYKQNDTWIAPNAAVIGDVLINYESSIWYRSVVRGDRNKIVIGAVTNIQEKCVIDTVPSLDSGFPATCEIGDNTSIGAGSVLRSCKIGSQVDIGDACIILDGAIIEDGAILEPGSLVPVGGRIPTGQKWKGNPVQFVANVSEEELKAITNKAVQIASRAAQCQLQYLPLPDEP